MVEPIKIDVIVVAISIVAAVISIIVVVVRSLILFSELHIFGAVIF